MRQQQQHKFAIFLSGKFQEKVYIKIAVKSVAMTSAHQSNYLVQDIISLLGLGRR